MRNESDKIQGQEGPVSQKRKTTGGTQRGSKYLFKWFRKKNSFLRKVFSRKQRKGTFVNFNDGLGYKDSGNWGTIYPDSSKEKASTKRRDSSVSLREQIEVIKKDFKSKVRLFSLRVRFLVLSVMFLALFSDLLNRVYNLKSGIIIFFSLASYSSVVLYSYFKNKTGESSSIFDLFYISCEIVATAISLHFWPAGRDAVYTSSLLIFMNFLILLSVLSGRWWYPIFSSFVVILCISFLQYSQYESFINNHVGTPIALAMPKAQIPWSLTYYFMTGLVIGYFFWNIYNMQSEYLKLKTEEVLVKTYSNLMLADGTHELGNYIIKKHSLLPDSIIGADFCSFIDKERFLFVCFGDAAGHGVNHSPAAVMCLTIFSSSFSTNPSCIFADMNRAMYKNGDEAYCVIVAIDKEKSTFTVTGKCEDMGLIMPGGKEIIPVPMKSKALGTEPEYAPPISADYSFPIGSKLLLRTDGALYSDLNDDQTTVVICHI